LSVGELEVVNVELGVLWRLEKHAYVSGLGRGEGHGRQGDGKGAVGGGEEDDTVGGGTGAVCGVNGREEGDEARNCKIFGGG